MALLLTVTLGMAGCAHLPGRSAGSHPAVATSGRGGHHAPARPDPPTRTALIAIAQRFNNDYDTGHFGRVWNRWDSRSRALISRAEYIRRHRECAPATGAVAKVEGAKKQATGAWHVRYEISGLQFVDTWYYADHRWEFDIIASNPRAAKQYALPFDKYAAAVGCTIH